MLYRLLDRVQGQSKKLAQVARIQARGQLYIPYQGEDPDDTADTADLDEAAAALGLQVVEDDDEDGAEGAGSQPTATKQDLCYLWPCNVAAFDIWGRLQTQWRVGMAGAAGLDYAGVSAYLRDCEQLKRKDIAEIFPLIQAMENATLDEWQKKQASNP